MKQRSKYIDEFNADSGARHMVHSELTLTCISAINLLSGLSKQLLFWTIYQIESNTKQFNFKFKAIIPSDIRIHRQLDYCRKCGFMFVGYCWNFYNWADLQSFASANGPILANQSSF